MKKLMVIALFGLALNGIGCAHHGKHSGCKDGECGMSKPKAAACACGSEACAKAGSCICGTECKMKAEEAKPAAPATPAAPAKK
jgi:hypothetical protein